MTKELNVIGPRLREVQWSDGGGGSVGGGRGFSDGAAERQKWRARAVAIAKERQHLEKSRKISRRLTWIEHRWTLSTPKPQKKHDGHSLLSTAHPPPAPPPPPTAFSFLCPFSHWLTSPLWITMMIVRHGATGLLPTRSMTLTNSVGLTVVSQAYVNVNLLNFSPQ